jgi:hypothetical protein
LRRAEPYIDQGVTSGGNVIGRGNGRFTFIDQNNNGVHNSGETCEPIIGDANGVWDVDAPCVSIDNVFATHTRLGEAYVQAEIRFNVGITFDDATEFDPREAPGAEPWTDVPPLERNLIDTAGDKNPKTVDIFVVPAMSSGSRGESFVHTVAQPPPAAPIATPAWRRNSIIVIPGSMTTADPFVVSHEMCHVLRSNVDHDMDRNTNLMLDQPDLTDSVSATKRLQNAHLTELRGSAAYAELRY